MESILVLIILLLVLFLKLHTTTADTSSQKCCEDLGCFDLGDPWNSILRPVPDPQCPNECAAEFRMFSRQYTSENYTVSQWPIDSFNSTFFDSNKTTVLFSHGWQGSWDIFTKNLKDAYLQRSDVNFIFLDWHSCASQNYLQAASSTRSVAAQAIRFIKYLMKNHGMSQCKMHIIGLSLGAHIGSYIAKEFVDKETNVSCIERLTGLEPAAPLFEGYSDEVQISSTDAKFVEIAHTETVPIIGPGQSQPRGHVDYYFNGNIRQPGCISTSGNEALQQKDGNYTPFSYLSGIFECGHLRSLIYYVEALSREDNCTFWGETTNPLVQLFNSLTLGLLAKDTTNLKQCTITTCSPFGLKAIEYPARGSFSVATNQKEPYCEPKPEIGSMMAEMLKKYNEEHYNNKMTTDASS